LAKFKVDSVPFDQIHKTARLGETSFGETAFQCFKIETLLNVLAQMDCVYKRDFWWIFPENQEM